jgi:hypothetical protein
MIAVEDWVAIANLLAEYQWRLDGGDAEAWAALFTDDGAVLGAGDDVRGRDALLAAARATFAGFGGRMRHSPNAMWIEYGASPNEAVARYYAFVTTWQEPGPELFNLGLCVARLRRVGGAWKIATNEISSLRGDAVEKAMGSAAAGS